MPERKSEYIAEREFERHDGQRPIRIALLRPRPHGRNGNYRCPVVITGFSPRPERTHGMGVDSLQAVCNAIQAVHNWVEERRRELGPLGTDWLSVPAQIPQLGRRVEARLKRAVNRELKCINAELRDAQERSMKKAVRRSSGRSSPRKASP